MAKKRGRPRRTYTVRRVRLDGYLPVGQDAEIDALLAWLDSLPNRKRFPIVIARLISGGVRLEQGRVAEELQEAEQAADELFDRFGG